MAKSTEARIKATAKYEAKVYDKALIRIKKGKKQVIDEIAKNNNDSFNGYVKKALKTQIKSDTGQDIDL